MKVFNKFMLVGLAAIALMVLNSAHVFAQVALPTLTVGVENVDSPAEFSKGLQILIMLTILTLAPSILVMTTSFTRIVIVLSLARTAIGTAQLPPAQVIIGLSLILTFFVMSPTLSKIYDTAYNPYMANEITQKEALSRGVKPLREFMFRQTDEQELAMFVKMANVPAPKVTDDVPTYVLLPSFILSELKTAFKIGFMIFIPFLVIDIVVASILVSMGMLFLPPTTIATPFKIILFVMMDGWHLIAQSLVEGFMH